MTGPLAIDFPDFTRRNNNTDQLLINDNFTTSGTKTYGPFPMWGIHDVMVSVSGNNANTGQIQLVFYADAATTIQLAVHKIDVTGLDAGSMPFRVLGPYMKVNAIARLGPSFSAALVLWTIAGPGYPQANTSVVVPISIAGQNVNAGATVNIDAGIIYSGRILWSIATVLGSWSADIQIVDALGNVTTISSKGSSLGGPGESFAYLYPQHFRVQLKNFTAAAGTFNVVVTLNPMGDGG